MVDPSEVCVLIPTYNEVETIETVVSGFAAQGYTEALVVDGGSTDGTREAARDAGARVVEQSGSGKGQAVREAMEYVDRPYIVMVDGDATYRPEDADRMLEPLAAGRAEHVIGNRFADMKPGAMSRLNRLGNGLINRAFTLIHGRDLRDILSGYRAFTRESMDRLALSADGFGIETEMAVECVRRNVRTAVVPVTYEPRPDESETNLRPFRDGAVILFTLYQMARTNNPLFYFGSVGVLSLLTGVVLAVYVGVEWFLMNTSHQVIAVVAGVAVLFGVQLVMFGVLSDLVVTTNREQTRRIERLARELSDESARPSDGGGRVRSRAESDQTADGDTDGVVGRSGAASSDGEPRPESDSTD